jgi:hypothetical protein
MVLLCVVAQVEARYGPIGDSANIDARLDRDFAKSTIGSEIDFDAPDGTPRWRGSSACSFRSVWRYS